MPIKRFKFKEDDIMNEMRWEARKLVICGELVAKLPLWGRVNKDKRALYLTEWIGTLNVITVKGVNFQEAEK